MHRAGCRPLTLHCVRAGARARACSCSLYSSKNCSEISKLLMSASLLKSSEARWKMRGTRPLLLAGPSIEKDLPAPVCEMRAVRGERGG